MLCDHGPRLGERLDGMDSSPQGRRAGYALEIAEDVSAHLGADVVVFGLQAVFGEFLREPPSEFKKEVDVPPRPWHGRCREGLHAIRNA